MKLGFIGVGKMGSALLEGVLLAGLCKPEQIFVHDAYQPAVDNCVKKNAVVAAGSNEALVENSETVLLCVKPQDALSTIEGFTKGGGEQRLLISIAAGTTIKDLELASQNKHRVVRVMPNTPALIGKGASAFALGKTATSEDAKTVSQILKSVGLAIEVKEPQLDAVTGLSGSGPAYIFTVIEALADGGVREGLSKPVALQLAAQTVAGAADLVLQTGDHPSVLRDNVTSPGGTTIAGLAQLEKQGLRSALIEAVRAATERSRELGGG
jgi:pyrroline-5-carboxylate reductase